MRSLLRLNWWTPQRFLPHGLSGVLSLLLGLFLTAHTLCGSFTAIGSVPLLAAYVLITLANATAGFLIAGRAPQKYQPVFRHAAIFQACLCYYSWRFSPACAASGSAWLEIELENLSTR